MSSSSQIDEAFLAKVRMRAFMADRSPAESLLWWEAFLEKSRAAVYSDLRAIIEGILEDEDFDWGQVAEAQAITGMTNEQAQGFVMGARALATKVKESLEKAAGLRWEDINDAEHGREQAEVRVRRLLDGGDGSEGGGREQEHHGGLPARPIPEGTQREGGQPPQHGPAPEEE